MASEHEQLSIFFNVYHLTLTNFWRFRGLRGGPRANWRSTVNKETCSGWKSCVRKQRWQLKTDQNGAGVWPNASTWMQLKSKSNQLKLTAVPVLVLLHLVSQVVHDAQYVHSQPAFPLLASLPVPRH